MEVAPAAEVNESAWPGIAVLQRGQYDQALQAANQALAQENLPRDVLADALYVRGVAQWHLAKDRSRVLQAGWALSRLLVEFPNNAHAAECLYYLGLVHQKLDQPSQARQLLLQAQQSPGASADVKDRSRKALLDLGGRDS
jgi:TolA-binding protein